MNRAILIVICDFLVSAMLSMMTGMVPAHTGGTGVGLDEQTTKVLLAEMHENLDKLERMRELLRETIRKNGGATAEQEQRLRELAQQIVALRRDSDLLRKGADKKKVAEMTAKELQKLLEAERRERLRAEMERDEQRGDLDYREKEVRDLRRSVADKSQELGAERIRREAAEKRELQTRRDADEKVRTARQNADEKVKAAQKNADEKVKTARQTADEKVRTAQKNADEKVRSARENAEARVKAAREDADERVRTVRADADEKVKIAKQDADEKVKTAQKNADEKIKAAEKREDETRRAADEKIKAAKQREDATRKDADEKIKAARKREDETRKDADDRIRIADAQIRAAEKRERDTRLRLSRKAEALEASNRNSSSALERERQRVVVLRHDLSTSQREQASMKDELASLRTKNEQQRLRINKQEDNLLQFKDKMNQAVNDFQKARADLEKERRELAAARTKVAEQEKLLKEKERLIAEKQNQLTVANKKLRNQVLPCYTNGVVKLEVDICEALMWGREQNGGGVFYLPLVDLGGKSFLVGHLDQFIAEGGSLSYHGIKWAKLRVAVPGGERLKPPERVPGPVLLAGREPRLAALPMRSAGREPLLVLTMGELRERGLENLYLFKAVRTKATDDIEYAELKERCSIATTENQLYIRNSGSRSELRAEPGDFVLTRNGEFVGTVVATENTKGSKRRGDQARVFVMPDDRVWNDPSYTIPYAKPAEFETVARKIREELYPRKRRR